MLRTKGYKKSSLSPINRDIVNNKNLYLTMSPKVEFSIKDKFDI
jgi:hypothetical protein